MPENSNAFFTSELLSKFLIGIITSISTWLIYYLVERYKNKLLYLKKTISYQLIGQTSTSHWGDIEIFYNKVLINNAYMFNVIIANQTVQDTPKDLEILFSVNDGAFFLREFGEIRNGDVAKGLSLTERYWNEYNAFLEVYDGLTDEQRIEDPNIRQRLDHFSTQKPFILPILNRKTSADFNFLVGCNNPNVPRLNVGIWEPGIKLEWSEPFEKREKRKIWKGALVMIVWILCIFPIQFYSPDKVWAVWLMFINSFTAYLIGVGLFRGLKSLRLI